MTKLTLQQLISKGWSVEVWQYDDGEYGIMLLPPMRTRSGSAMVGYTPIIAQGKSPDEAQLKVLKRVEPIYENIQDDLEMKQ